MFNKFFFYTIINGIRNNLIQNALLDISETTALPRAHHQLMETAVLNTVLVHMHRVIISMDVV